MGDGLWVMVLDLCVFGRNCAGLCMGVWVRKKWTDEAKQSHLLARCLLLVAWVA